MERAQQAGVDVIAYGRLIPDAELTNYVSIDPFKVGQQQAEVLMDELESNGVDDPRIVMINGAPTDSNSKPYKDGAHDIFDTSGAEIVEEYDTPDWSPDEAQREMEQTITNLGADGFDAVYSANDGMATGSDRGHEGLEHRPDRDPGDRPGRRALRQCSGSSPASS